MSLLSFIALELTPAAVVVGNAGKEERSLLLGADGEVIAAPAVPRRADVEASAFALLISFDAAGSAGLDLSGRLGVVGWNTLWYVTGGAAWVNTEYTATATAGRKPANC